MPRKKREDLLSDIAPTIRREMDAGRKIAEAEYHNWELTLLFGKMRIKRDDYFWDTDLQEIYDQVRNASNNKDAFRAGFTAGQTMFTIEILSLIVGALEVAAPHQEASRLYCRESER